MKKEHKQLIIIILLFSVAGLLMAKTIFKGQEPSKGLKTISLDDAEISVKTEAVNGISKTDIDFFELEENLKKKRPSLEWERDPFNISTKKYSLRLTGIIHEEGLPVAIIDGIIVHEGEQIEEGVIVKEIGTRHVIVEKEGKEYTLELFVE